MHHPPPRQPLPGQPPVARENVTRFMPAAPGLFLVYWMWRVRVRGGVSGIVVGATQPR